MKHCIHCKFCSDPKAGYPHCTRTDRVGNGKSGLECSAERQDDYLTALLCGRCGRRGRYFELRPATIPADADIQPDMKPGAIIRFDPCGYCYTPLTCRAQGCKQDRP